jgi:hypothetical protein
MPDPAYNQRLSFSLDFIPADLEANRAGLISPRQRELLRSRFTGTLRTGVYVGVVFGMISICAVALLTPGEFFHTSPSRDVVIGCIVVLGWPVSALMALAALLIIEWRKLMADLNGGRVLAVGGEVRRHTWPRSIARRALYITVDGCRFRESERVYVAFKDVQRCTVYYTPHGKTILSAEPLEED